MLSDRVKKVEAPSSGQGGALGQLARVPIIRDPGKVTSPIVVMYRDSLVDSSDS